MRRVWLVAVAVAVLLADVALVLAIARTVKSLGSPAEPGKVEPIRIGDKASTQREFRQLVLAHNLRTMADAYAQVGVHDPAWDDVAGRLLRGQAAAFAGMVDRPSPEALLADARRALSAGCTDPLVLYCCGVALDQHGDHVAAEPLIARSLENLRKSRYPRIRAAFAALRLARLEELLGKPAAAKWKAARSLLLDAATDGSYRKGEERVLLSHLTEYVEDMPAEEREGLYRDLVAAKVDPYVVAVFGGQVETEAAWDARGDSWASEVTDEGWRGFRDHLRKAERLLTEAWKAHPEWPEAPAEMIRVSSGLDGYNPKTRLWFDRAVAAEADQEAAYRNLLWFSRPRWGGSHEMIYRLGLECLRTGRFDTETPLWFLRALDEITDDLDGDKKYWRRPETKQHLKALFDGYANSAALSTVEKQRCQLLHAGAEWYLGNYKQAHALFSGITCEGGADEFEELYGASPEVARAEAELFAGPAGPQALRAQKLLDGESWEEAAQAYAEVLKQSELGESARTIAQRRQATAQWYVDLAAGNWVSLQPDPSLAGWIVRAGDWHVADDGTITGYSDKWGLWLARDADIGMRIEFRGEMELLASPDKVAPNCGVMFAVTGPSEFDEAWDWDYCEFVASELRQDALLGHDIDRDNDANQRTVMPAEVKGQNTFLVRMWDDTVTTYLNGNPVHRNVVIREGVARRPARVALGSICTEPGTIVRFRDVEVRRLLSRPDDL